MGGRFVLGGEERREEKEGGKEGGELSQGRVTRGRKEKAGFQRVLEGASTTVPAVGLGLCCGFRGLWQELRSGEIGTSPHLSRGSDSGVSTPKPGRVGGNSGHPQRAAPPPE